MKKKEKTTEMKKQKRGEKHFSIINSLRLLISCNCEEKINSCYHTHVSLKTAHQDFILFLNLHTYPLKI